MKQLDQQTANQIRSLYSLSTLHQIVEELVLNSLEANSTLVDVDVDTRMNQINFSVSDNGVGLSYDDLVYVGQRYRKYIQHTLLVEAIYHSADSSENRDRKILRSGESLNSILHCCKSMKIKTYQSTTGISCTKVLSTESTSVEKSFLVGSQGTIIECVDMFGRHPVRKKKIMSSVGGIRSEASLIQGVLSELSLVNCQVKFCFRLNGSTVWTSKTLSCSNFLGSICLQFEHIFGNELSRFMVPFSSDFDNCKIEGIAVDPTRMVEISSRSSVHVAFIDGRRLRVPKHLETLVEGLYRSFLLRYRDHLKGIDENFNSSFVMIITPTDHALISDASFQYEKQVKMTMSNFLDQHHPLYVDQLLEYNAADTEERMIKSQGRTEYVIPSKVRISEAKRAKNQSTSQKKSLTELLYQTRNEYQTFGMIAEKTVIRNDQHQTCDLQNLKMPIAKQQRSTETRITSRMIQMMEAISQLDRKFIVTRIKAAELVDTSYVCLIDQHAADERIRYEEFERETIRTINTERVQTLPGSSVHQCALSKTELFVIKKSDDLHLFRLIEANTERLANWYWSVRKENSQGNATSQQLEWFVVEACPMIYDVKLGKKDMIEFLAKVAESNRYDVIPPAVHRALSYKACRSAIMFGDHLELDQCEQLIRRLSKCKFPFQCAHGRPSMTVLFSYNQ